MSTSELLVGVRGRQVDFVDQDLSLFGENEDLFGMALQRNILAPRCIEDYPFWSVNEKLAMKRILTLEQNGGVLVVPSNKSVIGEIDQTQPSRMIVNELDIAHISPYARAIESSSVDILYLGDFQISDNRNINRRDVVGQVPDIHRLQKVGLVPSNLLSICGKSAMMYLIKPGKLKLSDHSKSNSVLSHGINSAVGSLLFKVPKVDHLSPRRDVVLNFYYQGYKFLNQYLVK